MKACISFGSNTRHLKVYNKFDSVGISSKEKILERGVDQKTLSTYLDPGIVGIITEFEQKPVVYANLINKYQSIWVNAFLDSIVKTYDVYTMEFLVALLYKIIKRVNDSWTHFYLIYTSSNFQFPFTQLMMILNTRINSLNFNENQDIFIISKILSIVKIFLLNFPEIRSEDSRSVMFYLHDLIDVQKSSDSQKLEKLHYIGISTLQDLLMKDEYKIMFFEVGGLELLSNHIKVFHLSETYTPDIQMLYESVKCLWIMSFNEVVKNKMTSPTFISNLVDILKYISKDKVIRLTLSTLTHTLNIEKNNQLMISFGIMKILELLKQHNWFDEDIDGDLLLLHTTLEKEVSNLSTFDVYKNEVFGRKLDFSFPAHHSQNFWKSNISRFDEGDYEIVKALVDIVKDESLPSSVRSVACHDLGEISRYHPQKNFILNEVDFKSVILEIISEEKVDADIKKEAIVALQKIMLANWDSIKI